MGGLGSRHTPGTWPLGDIMGWVAFGLMEEDELSEAALERLWVGLRRRHAGRGLRPRRLRVAVRHWFAWPGAALAALLLEHAARDTGE